MADWSLTGNAGTNPATNFLGTQDNKPLVVRTNGAEHLRVDIHGNVGAGTVAPAVRLHVKGNRVRLESADATRTLDLRADGSALDLESHGAPLYVNGTAEQTFLNPNGGNVGVGTTQPRTPLHVLGRIASGADFTSAGAITFFPPDGFAWFHIDNGPAGGRPIGRLRISYGVEPGEHEVINILQNAKVGIGTATPDARLTVESVGPALGGASDEAAAIGRMRNLFGREMGSQTAGVRGMNDEGHGVQGQSISHVGVEGTSQTGSALYAESQSGVGVWGVTKDGPFAGFFQGNVRVRGNLSKSGGGFVIDHPLDPARQLLHHSFVESADRKNIYDGTAVLDQEGKKDVTCPRWFEALNTDIRYQLTAIGAPAPNLHIAREMAGGCFTIAGGAAGQKICWQVTGIRDDAWARAHPMTVEEAKTGEEDGRYLHPELHGHTEERGMMWTRHPQRARAEAEAQGQGYDPPPGTQRIRDTPPPDRPA